MQELFVKLFGTAFIELLLALNFVLHVDRGTVWSTLHVILLISNTDFAEQIIRNLS